MNHGFRAACLSSGAPRARRRTRGGDLEIALVTKKSVTKPNLPKLTRANPELEVSACTDLRVLRLSRREADRAIRYVAPKDGDLVGRRLSGVGTAHYASRAYVKRRGIPRDPRQLAGHDIVAFAPEFGSSPEAQWLAHHGRGARVALRANSLAAYLAALRHGLGIGLYACHAAENVPGLVRVSKEVLLEEEYWAVVHVDMARAPRVRAVLDFMSDCARAEQARLESTLLRSRPQTVCFDAYPRQEQAASCSVELRAAARGAAGAVDGSGGAWPRLEQRIAACAEASAEHQG